MQRTTTVALLACLIFAAVGVYAEESDATETDQTPSDPMAGYQPKTDMSQHSRIDLDLKEIMDFISTSNGAVSQTNWDSAEDIYVNGKNSDRNNNEKRTLKGFATFFESGTDVSTYQAEPMAKLMNDYYNDWTWADKMVMAAFNAQTQTSLGDFASGPIAGTDNARNQVIKKLIAYHLVWLFVHHEMEAAKLKYDAGTYDSAVTSWDEIWAFYAGSLEGGTGTGVMPYVLAESRAANLETKTKTLKNGGKSMVNCHMMRAVEEGQSLIQTSGNGAKITSIMKCIRAQSMVPLIQGCLWYSYRTDINSDYETDYLSGTAATSINADRRAEQLAFCSAVLPWLHSVSASAATTLAGEVLFSNGDDDVNPNWETVKGVFTAENINKMGLSCKDIGTITKPSGTMAYSCTDGAISNSLIDSRECDSLAQSETCKNADGSMPGVVVDGSNGAATTGTSMLLAIGAAFLALAGSRF